MTDRLATLAVDEYCGDSHRKPGVYALECDAPDTEGEVRNRFRNVWPDTEDRWGVWVDPIADADTVLYTGKGGDVYDRLMDHAEGEVRKAGFVSAFPPTDIHSIEHHPDTLDTHEWQLANRLSSRKGVVVWSDGVLHNR